MEKKNNVVKKVESVLSSLQRREHHCLPVACDSMRYPMAVSIYTTTTP